MYFAAGGQWLWEQKDPSVISGTFLECCLLLSGLGKQALKLSKVVLQKELSCQAEDGILSGKQAYLAGTVKP